MLDLVCQHHEPAINFIQFAAIELETQLFAAQSQRMAPECLPNTSLESGTPTECGVMIS